MSSSRSAQGDDPAKVNVISVFTSSNPYPVAETIARNIRQHGIANLQAMGAGAVNQAVKSISLAYGLLLRDGIEITWRSELTDIVNRETEWTAMRFTVERQAA
jgi:stage V sporulation protein S